MVLGGPGAGKSHLISQLLGREDIYGAKFDRIFYFGPTKFNGLEQDEDNTLPTLSEGDVGEIIEVLKEETTDDYNVLFVFDDIIGDLYANRSKPWLTNLIFNRRHILGRGTLSILYTAQKFTTVPTTLRTATTAIFVPKVGPSEQNLLIKQTNVCLPPAVFRLEMNRLPKHAFLFCDLEHGIVYSDKFVKL